jgi:hypothetical protein
MLFAEHHPLSWPDAFAMAAMFAFFAFCIWCLVRYGNR